MYDKGNYKEMNKYVKEAINIHTSDDTDYLACNQTNITKGMKDFIPTIDLHCNMANGNTNLSKDILAKKSRGVGRGI